MKEATKIKEAFTVMLNDKDIKYTYNIHRVKSGNEAINSIFISVYWVLNSTYYFNYIFGSEIIENGKSMSFSDDPEFFTFRC
jgi:hypothetical protein